MGVVKSIYKFLTFPLTPSSAPTSDYQVANKKYVDDNSGGASFWVTWTGATYQSAGIIHSESVLPVGTGIRYKLNTDGSYKHGIVGSITNSHEHNIKGEPCGATDDVFEYDASGLKTGSLTLHMSDNHDPASANAWLTTYLNMKLGWKPALCGAFMIAAIDIVDNSFNTGVNSTINMVQQGTTNKLFADTQFVDGVDTSSGATAVTAYCYANGESRFDILTTAAGNLDAYDADIVIRWVIL